jgi:hypothetical protein
MEVTVYFLQLHQLVVVLVTQIIERHLITEILADLVVVLALLQVVADLVVQELLVRDMLEVLQVGRLQIVK